MPKELLANLAASPAFGLARNHPFVDGNKRTAHVCYRTFLVLNDMQLEASNEDMCTRTLALAEGDLPEAELSDWLRSRLAPQAGKHRINEPRRKYL
ncbi:MAG: type II toxin-antitoxin system death-on-curing family toxin [Pseudoxanthomonas sp.]